MKKKTNDTLEWFEEDKNDRLLWHDEIPVMVKSHFVMYNKPYALDYNGNFWMFHKPRNQWTIVAQTVSKI